MGSRLPRLLVVLVLSACGRIGYDPLLVATDAGSMGIGPGSPPDAPAGGGTAETAAPAVPVADAQIPDGPAALPPAGGPPVAPADASADAAMDAPPNVSPDANADVQGADSVRAETAMPDTAAPADTATPDAATPDAATPDAPPAPDLPPDMPASLAVGLVGHWKLDEASNGGTVADSSGYGNHGSYSAARPQVSTSTAPVSFANPNCLSFNGSNNYVTIPNSPRYAGNAQSSFTVTAWAYVAALTGAWRAVVTNEALGNYCGIWIGPTNDWTFEPAAARGATRAATLGWHHIAAVQDGSKNLRTIYVDGVASANTDTAVTCANRAALHIGSGDGTDDFWTGRIDDVRIYDRSLSATDIAALAAGQ